MKKSIFICLLLCLSFAMNEAIAATYQYTWQCVDQDCTFSANPLPGVLSYDWNYGDGTYGAGQNVSHSYDFPGSGTVTTRVTLSYHFANGTFRNVRCYITWYEPGVGGWGVPEVNSGTCSSFN